MKLKLKNVRSAFLQIWQAKAVNGEGEPRFSGAFIIDPKSPIVKELDAAIVAVAKDKWGPDAPGILAELIKKDRVAFKKAPRTNDKGEAYAGFEGMYSLNASSKVKPSIKDRDASDLQQSDGRPYSGCYVVAHIELWAQDNKFGKRINATLRGVQYFGDGDSFGGGAPASADEYEDLSNGADSDV